ncbi:hypothetical protein N0V87_010689, partial [Didymella glomerata]
MDYRTTREIKRANAHIVGTHSFANALLRPVSVVALQQTDLKFGSNVLEIDTASGRLIADAKCRVVSTGVCVGVGA